MVHISLQNGAYTTNPLRLGVYVIRADLCTYLHRILHLAPPTRTPLFKVFAMLNAMANRLTNTPEYVR